MFGIKKAIRSAVLNEIDNELLVKVKSIITDELQFLELSIVSKVLALMERDEKYRIRDAVTVIISKEDFMAALVNRINNLQVK